MFPGKLRVSCLKVHKQENRLNRTKVRQVVENEIAVNEQNWLLEIVEKMLNLFFRKSYMKF